eukprot:2521589-Rhodomonas_salina.2
MSAILLPDTTHQRNDKHKARSIVQTDIVTSERKIAVRAASQVAQRAGRGDGEGRGRAGARGGDNKGERQAGDGPQT